MGKYVLLNNKFAEKDSATGERIPRKKGEVVELTDEQAYAFRDVVEHVDVHKAKAKVATTEAKHDPEPEPEPAPEAQTTEE